MNVVDNYMKSIAWYDPTTDASDWATFKTNCKTINYVNATPETLKQVAWNVIKMNPGEDVGMWNTLQSNFGDFLAKNMSLGDYDSNMVDAIQYDFVACFKNNYGAASHNSDLWQSFNDQANSTLKVSSSTPISEAVGASFNPTWLLATVPAILYKAIREIRAQFWKPTEDTDSWAYFQNVMLDVKLMDNVYFVYEAAYLLTNCTGVDSGLWSTLSGAARSFLDANLGNRPADTQSQVKLAIAFTSAIKFDYQHAAHNASLFKKYNDTFANATKSLQALIKP